MEPWRAACTGRYVDADGRPVPSVTEVVSDLDLSGLGRVPEHVLDAAAARGTEVHEVAAATASGDGCRVPSNVAAPYVAAWRRWVEDVDPEFLVVEERMVFCPPVPSGVGELVRLLSRLEAGQHGHGHGMPATAEVATWWMRGGADLVPRAIGGTFDVLCVPRSVSRVRWLLGDYKTRDPAKHDILQPTTYLWGLRQLRPADLDGRPTSCATIHLSRRGSYRVRVHDEAEGVALFGAALAAWAYLQSGGDDGS